LNAELHTDLPQRTVGHMRILRRGVQAGASRAESSGSLCSVGVESSGLVLVRPRREGA
jgi:hypothetical protein